METAFEIIAEPHRRAILSLLVAITTVGWRNRASTAHAAADSVKAPASTARGRFAGVHRGCAATSLPAET